MVIRCELNRIQFGNPERTSFTSLLFIIAIDHLYLSPDSAFEQSFILFHKIVRDMDMVIAEIYKFSPVFIFTGKKG